MNSQSYSWFSFLHLLFTIKVLLLFQYPKGSSKLEEFYQTCNNTFSCGSTITGIRYPFRGFDDPRYCGHQSIVLNCDDRNNLTTIDILNMTYMVLEIDQTIQTMRIVREDVMEGTCPREMVNTTLDYSLFDYAAAYMNLTFLYGCPRYNFAGFSSIPCRNVEDNSVHVLLGTLGPRKCRTSVIAPVPVTGNETRDFVDTVGLDQVLQQGFEISWKISSRACSECTTSKGRCGYNFETNQTTCYCPKSS